MRRAARLLAAFVTLATWSAGCVSGGWGRTMRYAPVDEGALGALEPGKTDLAQCLSAFGAPLWVWEQPAPGGDGAALAYGWYKERGFGVRVSVPFGEHYSGSFDYDQADRRMKGLVLFFDQDWKLLSWRTGLLRDLVDAERRPTSIDE